MLINSKFRPAWWLRNPHAQTLWAAKIQRTPEPDVRREQLQTPDGDFLDLDWGPVDSGPTVVLFHGLTGSVDSHYARLIMRSLTDIGVAVVLMHFRGCSEEPNRLAHSYHSGATADIQFVIDTIAARSKASAVAAVGYSLGGNALLKYLATQRDNPLHYAIAVSPPLALSEGADRLNSGFSKIYQRHLVGRLKQALDDKSQRYPHLKLEQLHYATVSTLREFDERVTAPLNGFTSAADYYQRASTRNDLTKIKTPTHVVFAQDDPFFTKACIPSSDAELSEAVTFELTTHGGHIGFVEGEVPGYERSWITARVTSLLEQQFLKQQLPLNNE